MAKRAVEVVYRQGTIEDAEAIAVLAQLFLADSVYHQTAPGADVRPLVDLVLKLGAVVVAESEGHLVGFIGWMVATHPIGGFHYADEQAWYVLPAYRSQGVGLELLKNLTDWARTAGLFMVKLSAPAGTKIGAVYEGLGFTALETAYVKTFSS